MAAKVVTATTSAVANFAYMMLGLFLIFVILLAIIAVILQQFVLSKFKFSLLNDGKPHASPLLH